MPKHKTIRILGIDPGIADMGYGIIEYSGSSYTVLKYANIKTQKNTPLSARLSALSKELTNIIKKFNPDIAGVEELFFHKNVKTALTVAHARGVILMVLASNNVPVEEYTPLQIKQSLTTYGRASKNQVQQMVKSVLGMKEIPTPDDAADALAVAICCCHNQNKLKDYVTQ